MRLTWPLRTQSCITTHSGATHDNHFVPSSTSCCFYMKVLSYKLKLLDFFNPTFYLLGVSKEKQQKRYCLICPASNWISAERKVAILSGPECTPALQVPFTFLVLPNWQYFIYSRPPPMCFFIFWQQPHTVLAHHINKQNTKLSSHPDFPLCSSGKSLPQAVVVDLDGNMY